MIMNQTEFTPQGKNLLQKENPPVEPILSVFISELIYDYESNRVHSSRKEFAPKGETPPWSRFFLFSLTNLSIRKEQIPSSKIK